MVTGDHRYRPYRYHALQMITILLRYDIQVPVSIYRRCFLARCLHIVKKILKGE